MRVVPVGGYVFAAFLSVAMGLVAHGLLTYGPEASDAAEAGILLGLIAFLWTGWWLADLGDKVQQVLASRPRSRRARR